MKTSLLLLTLGVLFTVALFPTAFPGLPAIISGDCALSNTGAITCTKSSGTPFATVATSGNFSDLSGRPGAINTGASAAAPFGPAFQFTDPTVPSFAWQNQGGASVANSGSATALTIPQSSAANLRARSIAAPGTPYTIDAGFLLAMNPATPSGDLIAGLVWRRASSSKSLICGVTNNAGAFAFTFSKYTNDTTFSANYNMNTNLLIGTGPLWVRIANDGTNLTCGFSADGTNFVPYPTQLASDWFTTGAPDSVGFGADYEGGTAFTGYLTIVSWKQH